MISEFNQVVLNLLVNAAQAISEVVDKNAARKGHIRWPPCGGGTRWK